MTLVLNATLLQVRAPPFDPRRPHPEHELKSPRVATPMPHAAPPNLRVDRPSPRWLGGASAPGISREECASRRRPRKETSRNATRWPTPRLRALLTIHGGCQSITHGQRSLPAPAASASADVTASHSLAGAPRVPRSTATLVTVAVFLRASEPRRGV